jgi:cell division transport system permease protein
MTDAILTHHRGAIQSARLAVRSGARPAPSLVPLDSIGTRGLAAVIAIMTFLAALTVGAVVLVRAAATEWQSAVAREVTIQIRPVPGRELDADVAKATELARAAPGVADVRPYTREESARLLEPWLGSGLALDELPVPRLIVVRLDRESAADLVELRKQLAEQAAGASIDDHRGWIDRMRAMARTAVGAGLVVLGLVLVATMLSVTFATRGAMATNRPVVEVLHFVGAKDGFIAAEFQRHFLLLGLKGAVLGGGAALAAFGFAAVLGGWFRATPEQNQIAALFGSFSIGSDGYAAVLGLVILIAAITAATCRIAVHRTLAAIE